MAMGMVDPRSRIHAVSHDILAQLAGSLGEHLDWLDAHLESVRADALKRKDHNRVTTKAGATKSKNKCVSTSCLVRLGKLMQLGLPARRTSEGVDNLLRSPVRKRVATTNTTLNHPISIQYPASVKASEIFGKTTTSSSSQTLPQPQSQPQPFQQHKTIITSQQPAIERTGSNSSLSRSPGKTGGLNLSLVAAAAAAERSRAVNNTAHARASNNGDEDKENPGTRIFTNSSYSPSKKLLSKPAPPGSPQRPGLTHTNSLRSPAALGTHRPVLGNSTSTLR